MEEGWWREGLKHGPDGRVTSVPRGTSAVIQACMHSASIPGERVVLEGILHPGSVCRHTLAAACKVFLGM
jgi:hypothetical protein